MSEEYLSEKKHPSINVDHVPNRPHKQSMGPEEMNGKTAIEWGLELAQRGIRGVQLPLESFSWY